jgi:hypothetical protein
MAVTQIEPKPESTSRATPGTWIRAILAASNRLLSELGGDATPWDSADFESQVATIRAALGDEAFESAWHEGVSLTEDEALDLALECLDETTTYNVRRNGGRRSDLARWRGLHAHRVVAAVHVQRRARHVAGVVAEQVRGCGADVVRVDVAVER